MTTVTLQPVNDRNSRVIVNGRYVGHALYYSLRDPKGWSFRANADDISDGTGMWPTAAQAVAEVFGAR